MKKPKIVVLLLMVALLCVALVGCEYYTDKSDKWKTKFDISLPDVANAGSSQIEANTQGWYSTLLTDFEDNSLGGVWQPITNGLRREEYWCDKMIRIEDGKVLIDAKELESHDCDNCDGKSNLYTSGISTFITEDGVRKPTFEQAFGYYEATVKFPNSAGMWSAFWLNSTNMGNVGHNGEDGSEIDIYESSFFDNKNYVGQCIHYDGYGKEHKGGQAMHDVGYNLYEGYHKFALKWTPKEYVFYVDDVAVWATDFGGVSKVPSYLLLTNEIRQIAKTGPYGQKLGKFTGGTFEIESVNVYQNTNYLASIKSPSDFK